MAGFMNAALVAGNLAPISKPKQSPIHGNKFIRFGCCLSCIVDDTDNNLSPSGLHED